MTFFNCDIQDQEAEENNLVNVTQNTTYQQEEGCNDGGTLCDDDQMLTVTQTTLKKAVRRVQVLV